MYNTSATRSSERPEKQLAALMPNSTAAREQTETKETDLRRRIFSDCCISLVSNIDYMTRVLVEVSAANQSKIDDGN